MVRLGFICLAVALVIAFLGFAGVPEYSWEGARIFCVVLIAVGAGALVGRWFKSLSW
jgi:uncharacterized membrane protein YtjA (UPF0391 family)